MTWKSLTTPSGATKALSLTNSAAVIFGLGNPSDDDRSDLAWLLDLAYLDFQTLTSRSNETT